MKMLSVLFPSPLFITRSLPYMNSYLLPLALKLMQAGEYFSP